MTKPQKHKTKQEDFWSGNFGDEYVDRNSEVDWDATNQAYFSKIFKATKEVSSVLELGANRGLNLKVIQGLLPNAACSGIEINHKAAELMRERLPKVKVYEQSILDFKAEKSFDFVFSKGVLIHLNPDMLPEVYDIMVESSKKYICIGEYYSRSPQVLPYRGHDDGYMFKRDFAGELLDRHKNVELVEYGFVYYRDKQFPQDDISWFLLEKK